MWKTFGTKPKKIQDQRLNYGNLLSLLPRWIIPQTETILLKPSLFCFSLDFLLKIHNLPSKKHPDVGQGTTQSSPVGSPSLEIHRSTFRHAVAQFFGLAGIHLRSHQVNVAVSWWDTSAMQGLLTCQSSLSQWQTGPECERAGASVSHSACSAPGFLMWTEGRQQSSVEQQMFYTASVTLISWAESSSLY